MLEILFENDDIIFVKKSAGVSVHNDHGNDLISKAEAEKESKLHLVNRLDLGTSGIVLIAKNKAAASLYQTALSNGTKHYKALVKPNLERSSGLWEDRISSTAEGRKNPAGIKSQRKSALTYWKVENENPKSLMIDVQIKTGRKHQIRKHCALNKCPIIGDTRYGKPKSIFTRLALHCYRVSINIGNSEILVECPLEDEFKDFL